MKQIQILGTGCAACEKLARLTEQAARELGLEYALEKVGDIDAILAFNIMATPGLVVDGQLKVSGHVPALEEIKHLLA